MIADYNFYRDTYRGRLLIEPIDFSFFSERASDELSRFERIVPDTEEAQTVLKKCCCAIADILFAENNAKSENGQKVTSESVNGYYSATYAVVSAQEVQQEIRRTINKYLSRYIARARVII